MYEDIAEFVLKIAGDKGASYAEARFENTFAHSAVMKNGNVEATGVDKYEGLGMRFIVNKRIGFASTNEITKKKIKEVLEKAIRAAKRCESVRETTSLAEEKANIGKYEVKQKIKLQDLDVSERIQFMKDAEGAVMNSGVSVPSRYMGYGDHVTKEFLATSEGTRIQSVIPVVHYYYFLTVQEAGNLTQRYWAYGGTGGFEVAKKWKMPKIMAHEVTSLKRNMTKGKMVKPGVYPVVCGPQVTGIMCHESVGHPYEADRILGREAAQAGESFVTKDMIGSRIGSDEVTVLDDPTVLNSYGFYKYDTEGVRARKKELIKNGLINEFLHNRQTAFTMGVKSNGAARASDYDKEGIVRMSNTYLKPGSFSEEELFEGIKKGVFLKNFMEWNIDDKRMNQKYTGAEAYMIENGKITYPLRQPILEVTTTKLWPAVDAVGKNLEHHAGECGKGEPMQGIRAWLGGPSMRLRGLRIK